MGLWAGGCDDVVFRMCGFTGGGGKGEIWDM